ncbi:MAG: alpha/beta hydrolase, partial [Anaerolineae bacterium]
TFTSEGQTIHGRLWTAGSQAAVVFCHGAFERQENWAAFAERLNGEGFATFTFDFAGHGASEGLRGSVELRTWAYNIRDALNYLQSRGWNAFGLVGWESGGSAALLAAAHDKRLVSAAIISAPVYLVPLLADRVVYILASAFGRLKMAIVRRPLILSRRKQMEQLGLVSDQAANAAYFADPRVQEIYNAFPMPEGIDNVWVDITEAVEKVKVPVLVLHGLKDEIVPPSQSERLMALLSGRKELKLLDSSAHALHLDCDKDEVYSLISAWLKQTLDSR